MSNWYLIHTKIRRERVAQENLERQGYECFLPTILVEKLRGQRLRAVEEPLFTRYLFIRLDTSLNAMSWSPIRSTLGVSRLVKLGHTPAKIEDTLVEEIRTKTSCQQVHKRQFELGDAVVVTQGPFAGVEAIFEMADGEQRVMVLLNILSKQVRMSIPPAGIKKHY